MEEDFKTPFIPQVYNNKDIVIKSKHENGNIEETVKENHNTNTEETGESPFFGDSFTIDESTSESKNGK